MKLVSEANLLKGLYMKSQDTSGTLWILSKSAVALVNGKELHVKHLTVHCVSSLKCFLETMYCVPDSAGTADP